MPGLGDGFRAAREARHLSLSDVSEQIHIRSVYLQSIEEEDWSAIAAPVYVRGFLRTYARFLGLDPEAAVEHFNEAVGELAGRSHEPAALTAPARTRIRSREGPSPLLWGALVLTIVLVAFVGYKFVELQQAGNDATAIAVATAAATEAASAAPSSEPSAATATDLPTRTLELRVTAPTWLLVKIDGAQVLEGILQPGTSRSFHGGKALVRSGNAGGVDVLVNGKDLGPMGKSGDVVEKSLVL